MMHEVWAEWSRWGWPLIGNHLWQSTLAALVIVAAASFLKRAPAQVRHALWLVASIKFAAPSFLFFYLLAALGIALPSFASEEAGSAQTLALIAQPLAWQEEFAVSNPVPGHPTSGPHSEVFCALTIFWLAGCAGVLLVWSRKRRDFARAMKAGRACCGGREAAAAARVRSWIGIRRRVGLIVTPGLTEPGVWRVWRPVLVLPESMSELLSEAELEAVIMHEMVHIARWDNLSSSFQMLLCGVFWFHPIVWLIDRRLLVERERACDEKVVELSGAAKVYASSLVKVLGFCLGWKVAGVSLATGSNLQRRIEQIMTGNMNTKLVLSHRVAFGAVIAAVIFLSIAASLLGRDHVAAQIMAGGQPAGDVRALDDVPEIAEEDVEPEALPFPRVTLSPEVLERLSLAPELPLEVFKVSDEPVSITDARLKATELDEGDGPFAEGSIQNWVRPQFTITNNTGRRIKVCLIELRERHRDQYINLITIRRPIEPYGSYTVNPSPEDNSLLTVQGDPSDLALEMEGVVFEDGGDWGQVYPPPPPLPPPPPPPSRPGAPPEPEPPAEPPPPPDVDGPAQAPAPEQTPAPPNETPTATRPPASPIAAAAPRPPADPQEKESESSVIKKVDPEYPPIAKAANASGDVEVEVVINEKGNVVSAKAVSGHPLLREPAVKAARKWKFKPTKVDSKPVKVTATLTFNFKL
ncbi:MAG TPA: TonB family protein [Blastocatellia bacterium]|nr:TonB family protein [Blastocatellia bacterium]